MEGVKSAWTQPPVIKPNYGKPKSMFPKSNLARVLLHDNVNHEHLLQVKLSQISIERRRSSRLLENHRKSFVTRQSIKHQQLRAMGVTHHSLIPDHVATAHFKVAKLVHRSPEKDLSSHHRLLQPKNARERPFTDSTNTHSDDKQLLSIPANIITPSRKPQTIHCRMNNPNKVVVLPKEPLTHFRTRRTRALSHPDGNNNSISRNDADDSSNRDGVDNTESKYGFKSSRIFDARFSQLRNSLIPPYKPGDEYLQRTGEERGNVLSIKDAGKHVSFLPGLTVMRGQTF